jgi:hypothetical protein
MQLSEETIKKAIYVKSQYDLHKAAMHSLAAELHVAFRTDLPEITEADTIHWMENFSLEEPHED